MATRPKLTVSFTERDLGMSHFLREAAKLRKKPAVKAGVVQSRGSKLHVDPRTGKAVKTVAYIAACHEFGGENGVPPERSFMRSTKAKNESKYNAHIEKLGSQIFDAESGMTTERALGLIGQEYIADVKNTIRAGIAPPLKPSTIREKNAVEIGKAGAKVRGLEGKLKLSKADKGALFKAQETVDSGGDSTPLIDTAQLINSLTYQVVMDGSSAEASGPTVEEMAAGK